MIQIMFKKKKKIKKIETIIFAKAFALELFYNYKLFRFYQIKNSNFLKLVFNHTFILIFRKLVSFLGTRETHK